MSEIVCRRVGCTNLLSDEDVEQNFEHCSSDCCAAVEDLNEEELAEKQERHSGPKARDVATLGREEHEARETKRRKIRKLRGNHKREKKNPKTLRARRSAGKGKRGQ